MSTDFSSDEVAVMKELGIDPDLQAADDPEAQAAPTATQQSAQPALTPAPQTATPSTGQPAAEPPQPGGDVRAALRASRRAEQRARDEAARLRDENAALKARAPAAAAEPDPMSEEEIARAERDFPLLGRTARFVKAHMTTAPAAAAPASQAAPDFVPPYLPPNVQEVVDSSPALLAWQHDPDQARFELAKVTDALLLKHPQWVAKTMAERLNEVVRRVNAELPSQAAPATHVDPSAALAAVPRRTPETLTHIGGGGGIQPEAPAKQRFMQMSEEAITAELMRGD